MKIFPKRGKYLGIQFKSTSWAKDSIFTFINYNHDEQIYILSVNVSQSRWQYTEKDIAELFENGSWIRI